MRNPYLDFSINAIGTFNVLEYMRKKSPHGVFIYCSTNKVYGENVSAIPLRRLKRRYCYKGIKGIDETMPIDKCGHTPYGVSKYVGDIYTQEYALLYKMRTAVFRMSCIYGTRQFGFEDQGWVAWFVIAALKNKPIAIYGDGKQVRDLLYVEDLIQAYDLFFRSKLQSAVYNIGGGKDNVTSLVEFLDIIKKEIGSLPPLRYCDWRPSDQKVYISDISLISKKLKWKPTVSPRQGVQKYIQWAYEHKSFF
jgi:CDP-paratose 2-epimerase